MNHAVLRAAIVSMTLAVTLLVFSAAGRAEARIDAEDNKIAQLARTLRTARSEKARIAAAIALGRLKDKRAVKPLVAALTDRSELVRAVAAASLGHIGDTEALPALRRAISDRSDSVRKRAGESIIRIDRKNGRANPSRAAARRPSKQPVHRFRVSAGERPRLSVPARMIITIQSFSDESETKATKGQRVRRVERMRDVLAAELARAPGVEVASANDKTDRQPATAITTSKASRKTSNAELQRFHVDGTILKLRRRVNGPWIEMQCEIRLSVSNGRGKMLSFLTGGATVQVPRTKFTVEYEPQMREEALEGAVIGINDDLVRYLNTQLAQP